MSDAVPARSPMVETLPALLARTVERTPDAHLVVDGSLTLDSTAFAAQVSRSAGGLRALGVKQGQPVALWMTNGASYLIVIFALAQLGAVAVHVNTRYAAGEISDLLVRTDARLVITEIADLGGSGEAKLRELQQTPALSTVAFLSAADIPISSAAAQPEMPVTGDDDCLIYTTGGTTSKPKLVVHTHRSIVAAAEQIARSTGLDAAGSSLLAAVPFCGTYGNNLAMAAIAVGAATVPMATFDAERAATLIKTLGISHAIGDDKMISRLAAAAGEEPYTTLRFFGAAAFGADSRRAFATGLEAGIPIQNIYGSSEAQTFFGLAEPGVVDAEQVIPIYPDARFRIVNGELQIQSPSLFDRYLGEPEQTARALADGWFHTGDRARYDGDGFIYEGRNGDVLRLGGFLVAPQEIEAFLTSREGISQAVVVGHTSERGTLPVAFVIADDTFDEQAVLADARVNLARYKVPAAIVQVDAFPVVEGPNGPKIARAQLREDAARRIDST